uniref:Protein cramped-like n=1 Tax=Myripristis murdjan TaxID=586833 RepID=A0A667YGY6_9TELE
MTLGSREGIGVDGGKNSSRKPEGCDEEESGEQGSEERSTKGDGVEILNPSTTGLSPSPAAVLPTSLPNQAGPGSTQQPQTPAEAAPPCHDQHHFLRSSVRPPSKRIRKDSIGSTINGHGGAKSKGAENGSSSQAAAGQSGAVTSSTVSKASRGHGPADKEEQAGNQKRARRQWESWSAEDKNSFFEGLYEHGKDFEAIQNNIAMKYKKRGKPANMVKNKEQVRHFYYRTWHKISKYIDFANVYSRAMKKSSQELYGLICYAELRKKVGGLMDDKNVAKLNELIQQGATTVRSKGRNLRIKAPMCRALKKLCDPDGMSDEEDQKPVRLPLKVAVELQPRSNHSWARVQSLAHNPRLRMVVELHRKVSSLIEYLKQKWAFHDERIVSFNTSCGQQGFTSQQEELFLYPAESSTLTTLPGVARVVHSKASCTVHWQESGKSRPGAKELPAAQILGIHSAPPPRGGAKSGRGSTAAASASVTMSGDTRRPEPSLSDPPLDSSTKAEEKKLSSSSAPSSSQQNVTPSEEVGGTGPLEEGKTCSGMEATGVGTKSKERPSSGAESSSEQCREEPNSSTSSPEANRTPPGKLAVTGSEEAAQQGSTTLAARERTVEQIREEGWNARGTENVTLAELYLMLGKPSKLQLEYEWQPAPRPPSSTHRVLRCLLRLVATEVNPKPLVGTNTLVTPQEEQTQALTPPGKAPIPGVRSPSCGRQPASVRGAKLLLPNAAASGGRNLPRSLLGPTSGSDSEGGVFAVPTTLPPNSSRHSRMFSPNKEAELALRQQLDSISMQSDLFLPKHRKSRNRQLRKPLVVQRTLLPRTTGDTPQHVCSFSILSNSSATGTTSKPSIQTYNILLADEVLFVLFCFVSGAIDLAAKSAGIIPGSPRQELEPPSVDNDTLLSPAPIVESEPDAQLLQNSAQEVRLTQTQNESFTILLTSYVLFLQNGVPPPSPGVSGGGDSLLSPPSVASLLDISLPGPPEEALAPGEHQTHISDSIIELAINSAHYGEEAALSPAKLSNNDSSKLLASSPPVSPSRGWIPSPSHDPQWYPSDSTDSTLGCLLSSLVSPDKGRRTTLTPSGPSSGTAILGPSLLDCNSHDSFQSRGLPDVAEMDTQLACMMSESSVDYIARFNDLAQELSVTEPSIPPP